MANKSRLIYSIDKPFFHHQAGNIEPSTDSFKETIALMYKYNGTKATHLFELQ